MSLALHASAFATLGRARVASAPRFDPASQTLAGETLDVDPAFLAPPEDEPVHLTPTASPAPTPTPPRTASPRVRPGSASATAPAPPPALFGAVGVRFATDLATTFTRAFPQAASADPAWSTVGFGSAGRAEIALVLDDAGHLTGSDIAGFPSPALRRSIERTLVLVATRAFTARGALTKLRVNAQVSRDDVHDGLHGDVFALSAGSFAGDLGSAFFALPPAGGAGRRVDVEVRLIP